MSRKAIPKEIEHAVLIKSRRRCALCFHLLFDLSVKRGQIAHIDRNPDNNAESNLVYLCLPHHDEYDTYTSQSKSLKPAEAQNAKAELEKCIAEHHKELFAFPSRDASAAPKPSSAISLDVFNIRIPIYRAFHRFVSYIVQEAKVPSEILFDYTRDIHDALFLFDDALDQYLQHVYRYALRLRTLQRRMESPERYNDEEWSKVVDNETELILWFDTQLEEGRHMFNKYLNISSQQADAGDSDRRAAAPSETPDP